MGVVRKTEHLVITSRREKNQQPPAQGWGWLQGGLENPNKHQESKKICSKSKDLGEIRYSLTDCAQCSAPDLFSCLCLPETGGSWAILPVFFSEVAVVYFS